MQYFKGIVFIIWSIGIVHSACSQCVTATGNPTANLCAGDTVHLSYSFNPSCFLYTLPAGCVQKTDSIGVQHHIQSGTPYNAKTIYGNFYKGHRFQFLYTAAELSAVFDTGYIEQLRWRIGVFNSNATLENFTISIKSISADSTLLTDWQTGMTAVWGPQLCTPYVPLNIPGWANTHVLTTPYYWDGVSNLVIEVRSYNPVTSSNLVNMMSVTTDTGKALYAVGLTDVYSNQTPPTAMSERPVLMMKVCQSSLPVPLSDTITNVYWTTTGPDAVQYDSAGNAFAVVSASQSYRANVVRNNMTKISSPVSVTIDTLPQILPSTANLCAHDTVNLTTQLVYDSYLWSNGDTMPLIHVTNEGWYAVTVTRNGCVLKSEDSVHIYATIPAPYIQPNSVSLCEGEEGTVYTSLAYDAYQWNTGDTTRYITVSDSGWYSVTVTQSGCTAASVDSLHVYAVPPINPYVVITPGVAAGENLVTVLPPVGTHYWLQKTYDTVNGTIYIVNSQVVNNAILFCSKDSGGNFTSNYIRWIVEDAHFCRDTTDWVELTNCITGIQEHAWQLNFSVYPNPVAENTFITISDEVNGDVQLEIRAMQGRLVDSYTYSNSSNGTTQFNTSKLASGVYMLKVRSGTKIGQTLMVK